MAEFVLYGPEFISEDGTVSLLSFFHEPSNFAKFHNPKYRRPLVFPSATEARRIATFFHRDQKFDLQEVDVVRDPDDAVRAWKDTSGKPHTRISGGSRR